LNPLQASFFGKVVGLLITRKGELVIDFLKSHDQFLERVLHHLGTSAIMDLLLRLVTSLEPMECRGACVAWIQEQHLVQQLVSMIDPAHTAERNCNAAQALCDLICITREQMTQLADSPQPDLLLTEIESQETVSLLLSHMFDSGEIVDSVITSGLQVIQTLLEYRRVGPEGNLEQMIQADMERFSQGIHNTIGAVVPRLTDFHRLLLEPPKQHYVPMPWTIGVLDRPLGNTRLQTVRLIATLLAANVSTVSDELARLGTMNVLLDLYFQYAWNNFLHRQVEICLSTIVLNDSPDSTLLTQLITEFKLLEKVVKGFSDNQKQQSTPGGHRQGYMGHLTRVANSLVNNTVNSRNAQKIDDLILSLPAEVQESWGQFKVGPLADINKKNNSELVGSAITSSRDIDEFGRIAFPQDGHKIGRTARLFGFNEDDLNGADDDNSLPFGEQRLSLSPSGNSADAAAMFDDTCSRRVFDQGDITDEDLWVEKEITFSPSALESAASPVTTASSSTATTAPNRATVGSSGVKGQMVVSSPDSDEDNDDDDRERRHRRDSSEDDDDSDEEDEEIPESRRRIRQQVEPLPTCGGSSDVKASAEEMDISSSDDWARFDDMMDVTPATNAQPLPWESGSAAAVAASAEKIFSDVDTSSSSANDSWANFASCNEDDANWADFTGFGCSGQQHNSFESVLPSSSTSTLDGVPSRSATYFVSSSSDIDSADHSHIVVSNSTEVYSSAVGSSESSTGFEPCFTSLDICSSTGPSDEMRSGDDGSTDHDDDSRLSSPAVSTENGPL
jgi:serine/threonine-protein phosphatase 6 regulatory subunit 3